VIAALLALLLAPAADPPPCVDAARELLRAGRHEAAATDAERCWQLTRYPTALLIASQARVHCRHHAHAALDLDRYREHASTDSWTHSTLTELSNLIHRNTGQLIVELAPPLRPEERVRFDLEFLDTTRTRIHGRAALLAFRLDPGRWRLTVRRDGYADSTVDLTITHDKLRHTVHARPLAGPPALTVTTAASLLQLGPPRALERGVTVQLRSDDPHAAVVTLPASAASLALYLPRGRWHLQARAPGYSSVETTFTAGGGRVQVQLRRTGKP
jgi:hypothetical protein